MNEPWAETNDTGPHQVLGYLFNPGLNHVVLVEKAGRKLAWQKGKLNGIGGFIAPGETPAEAMRRKFMEEAGLDIDTWEEYLVLDGAPQYRVHVFRAISAFAGDASTCGDEMVSLYNVDQLNRGLRNIIIPNLAWMIPLAFDRTLRMPIIIHDTNINPSAENPYLDAGYRERISQDVRPVLPEEVDGTLLPPPDQDPPLRPGRRSWMQSGRHG